MLNTEQLKEKKPHRQKMETERLKSLDSGGGDRKNREGRERTRRAQEGEGVSEGGEGSREGSRECSGRGTKRQWAA